MALALEKIQAYYKLCDPDEPLAVSDPRYVDTGAVRQQASLLEGPEDTQAWDDDPPPATQADRSLHITSLTMTNVRCFGNLTVDLSKDQPTPWTLLLGNNASGKSSFLRALVLGLCDETTATTLLKRTPGSFVRHGQDQAVIKIALMNGGDETYEIETIITPAQDGETEIVRKTTSPDPFPWADVFVCAYGVERTKQADVSYKSYRVDQAVLTLFDYDASLQNPELILLRQSARFRKEIERKLLEVLMLEGEGQGLSYTSGGIQVTGPWGQMPFDSLSDGYCGTMQWVTDFLGWLVYAGRFTNADTDTVSGIVIIDELEKHLHPKWQRQIISRLKKQFPNVQFFASTHSPLIAGSVGSVLEDGPEDKMLHLATDGKETEISELENLKGLTVNQMLASPAFDYMVQADPEVEDVLAEASRLAGNTDRTEDEESRYKAIKGALKTILARKGDTPIEQEASGELYREMKAEIAALEAAAFGGMNDPYSVGVLPGYFDGRTARGACVISPNAG